MNASVEFSTHFPNLATYDPGWNDPPPMPTAAAADTNQATNVAKPRTSLNKRVAFPMQSAAASQTTVKTTAEGLPLPYSTAKYQPPPSAPLGSASLPPQTMSPPPTLPPPPSSSASAGPAPQASSSASPPIDVAPLDNFDSTSAREQCHSIFGQFAEKMATSTHATEPSKLNEIRKRLESLHHMWLENKLDDAVQKNLHALAKGLFGFSLHGAFLNFNYLFFDSLALENQDAAAAMEQHRYLVTHHIHVSTHWATALRQLILTLCPDIESTTQDTPALLPETETVQFVDISTKPVVLDSNVPAFLQGPNQPIPAPISDTPNTSSNDNEDASSANTTENIEPVESNQNTSKSKFGRFGRILHI